VVAYNVEYFGLENLLENFERFRIFEIFESFLDIRMKRQWIDNTRLDSTIFDASLLLDLIQKILRIQLFFEASFVLVDFFINSSLILIDRLYFFICTLYCHILAILVVAVYSSIEISCLGINLSFFLISHLNQTITYQLQQSLINR